jgi:hypothetical protein
VTLVMRTGEQGTHSKGSYNRTLLSCKTHNRATSHLNKGLLAQVFRLLREGHKLKGKCLVQE